MTKQSRFGGQGRIRTSVARKGRQIYSLLVLAAHPPVRPLDSDDYAFLRLRRRTRNLKTDPISMTAPPQKNAAYSRIPHGVTNHKAAN